jgi:hypothetical protein
MWIIDFEASGLSKQSYPIEVGLTNGSDDYQALIKPMDHWQYWSEEAEAVHRITRIQLESDGLNPAHVAHILNHKLSEQTVYCDSVQWDGFWCNVLFSDNGIHQRFEVRDIQEFIKDSDDRLEAFLAARNKLENTDDYTIHRALDDAKIIWKALQL